MKRAQAVGLLELLAFPRQSAEVARVFRSDIPTVTQWLRECAQKGWVTFSHGTGEWRTTRSGRQEFHALRRPTVLEELDN